MKEKYNPKAPFSPRVQLAGRDGGLSYLWRAFAKDEAVPPRNATRARDRRKSITLITGRNKYGSWEEPSPSTAVPFESRQAHTPTALAVLTCPPPP